MTECSLDTEPAVKGERFRWWPEGLTLAIVAVGTLLLLLYFLREPVMSDDLTYWRFSSAWSKGKEPQLPNHHRLAFLLSAYLGRMALGPTMASYYVVTLTYGVALALASYVVTRLFFPRPVAFAGAGLLATSPLFLQDATVLVPDWPVMFWVLVGIALLVVASRQSRSFWTMLVGGGGGATFFLALSVKEQVAPLLPVVAVCVIVGVGWRDTWRPLAAAAVSGLALVAGELVFFAAAYGDPLHRVHSLLGGHLQEASGGSWVRRGLVEPDLTWVDLGGRYLAAAGSTTSGRMLLVLGALALGVALVTRSRGLLLFAVPGVLGAAFVAFAVVSVDPLVPLLRTKVRYLAMGLVFFTPLIAAAAWTVANGVWGLVERRVRGSVTGVGSVAGLAVLGMAAIVGYVGVAEARDMPEFIRTGGDGVHRTVEVIRDLQEQPGLVDRVMTDGRTATAVRMALPREKRDLVNTFNLAKRGRVDSPSAFREGDIVVVNRKRIGADGRRHPSGGVPRFFLIPPLRWELSGVSDFADFRIYRVSGEGRGTNVTRLAESDRNLARRFHGYVYGKSPGTIDGRPGKRGMRFTLRNTEDARVLLGAGRDHRPPEHRDAQRLAVPEAGRLGVQVWLKVPPKVEVKAAWARTYDGDGVAQRERLRRTADRRGRTNGVSYAGSLSVDPDVDQTFRVLVVLEGTGEATVDRVSPVLLTGN